MQPRLNPPGEGNRPQDQRRRSRWLRGQRLPGPRVLAAAGVGYLLLTGLVAGWWFPLFFGGLALLALALLRRPRRHALTVGLSACGVAMMAGGVALGTGARWPAFLRDEPVRAVPATPTPEMAPASPSPSRTPAGSATPASSATPTPTPTAAATAGAWQPVHSQPAWTPSPQPPSWTPQPADTPSGRVPVWTARPAPTAGAGRVSNRPRPRPTATWTRRPVHRLPPVVTGPAVTSPAAPGTGAPAGPTSGPVTGTDPTGPGGAPSNPSAPQPSDQPTAGVTGGATGADQPGSATSPR